MKHFFYFLLFCAMISATSYFTQLHDAVQIYHYEKLLRTKDSVIREYQKNLTEYETIINQYMPENDTLQK